ncbi:putative COPI associated protein [Monocercomonoides exilis]|uniref:putative COPI associated protein n=1 Tax=Monocercomonoides exilis TaxID=2049356 RepID=UPI00355ACB41|nr:putative COPI associated protein [Monocercomonoides exilis]
MQYPPQNQPLSMASENSATIASTYPDPVQQQVPQNVQLGQPAQGNSSSKMDYLGAFLTVIKTCVLLTGPLLIAVGILSFVYFKTFRLVSIFFALYLIFFGALLFFAEFKWNKFLKYFPFLMTRRYRAFFMAFAGTLCFGLRIGEQVWPGYATGIWSCVVGAIYFISTFLRADPDDQKMKDQFTRENVPQMQNQTSASSITTTSYEASTGYVPPSASGLPSQSQL